MRPPVKEAAIADSHSKTSADVIATRKAAAAICDRANFTAT
jgi:hypothetical protein